MTIVGDTGRAKELGNPQIHGLVHVKRGRFAPPRRIEVVGVVFFFIERLATVPLMDIGLEAAL